jgi:hypothetical protein
MTEPVLTNTLASPYPYSQAGVWLMHHDIEQWMFAAIAGAAFLFCLNQFFVACGHIRQGVTDGIKWCWKRIPSFWGIMFYLALVGFTVFIILAVITGRTLVDAVYDWFGPVIQGIINVTTPQPVQHSMKETASSWTSWFVGTVSKKRDL